MTYQIEARIHGVMGSETRGARIRRLRAKRGLTQRQVAKQLGTDTALISHWEADRHAPNLESIEGLAGVLRVSIDYIVTGRESRATLDV